MVLIHRCTDELGLTRPSQPFILLARAILLAIESGSLDPEKAGSGVSYGDRALRQVSSTWTSLKPRGSYLSGKCCGA